MFLHAIAGPVEAVLDGLPDAGESLEIRRVEAEERRILGGLDHQ